jgi:hypothetical protein
VEIDLPPFSVFRWTRPRVPKNYFPLAEKVLEEVVRRTDQRTFAHLFSALLLEKTIVVFHPEEEVVSSTILALHFMLRPLRWASGSVSVLPEVLEDLLSAPNPLLIGMTQKLTEMQPWFVYFDLERQRMRLDSEFMLLPGIAVMEKALKGIWQRKSGRFAEILGWTSIIVTKFLTPITQAIMSDWDERGNVFSRFCREAYLAAFGNKERAFADAFSTTQMFQVQVEQDCRRRSDRLSQKND